MFSKDILDAVGRFIARQGIAAAIAAYMVYWLTTSVSASLQTQADQLKDLNGQLLHASQALSIHSDDAKEQARQARELTRLIRVLCLHGAKNDQARAECLP